MPLNLPPRVRQALYILTAIGTPAVVYALAAGHIGDLEFVLWSGEVAVVSAMAGFNVTAPPPPNAPNAPHVPEAPEAPGPHVAD